MSKAQKVFISLILVGVLGSTSPVINKILLQDLSPFVVSFFRFFISSLVILPIFVKHRKKSPPLTLPVLGILFLSSLNILLFILGVSKTSANSTQSIYTGTPLFVAFFAWVFLNERLTKYKSSGIFLGLIGVLCIIILPQIRSGAVSTGNLSGNILVFLAMISWSLYTVGSRYLTNRKHYLPLYLISVSFFLSTALFIGAMIYTGEITSVFKNITLQHLALLSFLGVAATICNYFLYQWVIHHASASTASLASYIGPPSGFFLAWLLLGEQLSKEIILGTIFVILGVYLASRYRAPKLEVGEGL